MGKQASESEDPGELQESVHRRKSDSILRGALITSLVAICLNPVSIWIGFHLSNTLNSSQLTITSIGTDIYYSAAFLEPEIYNPVERNVNISRFIEKNTRGACRREFKRNQFTPVCADEIRDAARVYIRHAEYEKGIITANMTKIDNARRNEIPELDMRGPLVKDLLRKLEGRVNFEVIKDAYLNKARSYLSSVDRQVSQVDTFIEELQKKVRDDKQITRTGEVDFEVTVVNSGNAVAIVSPEAELQFSGTRLSLRSKELPGFVVVPSKSFSKIQLKVDMGTNRPDDISKWSSLVMNKMLQEFELVMRYDGDREVMKKGELPIA